MKPLAEELASSASQKSPQKNNISSSRLKSYSLAEIAEHDDEDSCWLIIHNDVFNLTDFIDEHPGGADILLQYAGGRDREECDWDFDSTGHSEAALKEMNGYLIGRVGEVTSE